MSFSFNVSQFLFSNLNVLVEANSTKIDFHAVFFCAETLKRVLHKTNHKRQVNIQNMINISTRNVKTKRIRIKTSFHRDEILNQRIGI